MENEFDPAEALSMAKDARERLAARAVAPSWYGWLYGIGCGFIVAGGGMRQPLGAVMTALGIAGVVLLYMYWQKISGLNVNGYRKGRTRGIAILLGILLSALMMAGLVLRTRFALAWAPLAAGAVALPVSMILSMAWDRAWRREILGTMK